MRGQHTPWPFLTGDDDADAADDVVVAEPPQARETRLGPQVFHDDRLIRAEGVPGLRLASDPDRLVPEQSVLPADTSDTLHGAAVGKQLQHLAVLDAERLR